MQERLSTPEQRPETGVEYEAEQLMWLSEYIVEMYQAALEGPSTTPDAAFDALTRFSVANALRDPELGRWTVRKLSERALEHNLGDHDVTAEVADQHDELARAINTALMDAGHVEQGWLDQWWERDGYVPPPSGKDLD